jgi:hypothetical protein
MLNRPNAVLSRLSCNPLSVWKAPVRLGSDQGCTAARKQLARGPTNRSSDGWALVVAEVVHHDDVA